MTPDPRFARCEMTFRPWTPARWKRHVEALAPFVEDEDCAGAGRRADVEPLIGCRSAGPARGY
jgi:hypothetical protein